MSTILAKPVKHSLRGMVIRQVNANQFFIVSCSYSVVASSSRIRAVSVLSKEPERKLMKGLGIYPATGASDDLNNEWNLFRNFSVTIWDEEVFGHKYKSRAQQNSKKF